MTELFAKLTQREKEIIAFLIEQIKANGEYTYTVRQLVEELKLHNKTLAKALEKAKDSGYFVIEDLGLRNGYRIKFSSKFANEAMEINEECLEIKEKGEIGLENEINTDKPNKNETIAQNAQNTPKLIGREKEVEAILKEVGKRKDVLLVGPIGSGKTAILREIVRKLESQNKKVVYANYATSFKHFLVNLVYQMHEKYNDIELYELLDKQEDTKGKAWKEIRRRVAKLTTSDLAGLVFRSTKRREYTIICDALEMITPTAKANFESLRENCCLIGATHTIKDNPHLKKLWWRFKHIEIKNLELAKAKELIDYLYTENNINAYDKEAYKRKILKVSNGNCAAIYDMVFHSSKEKYLDHQDVRDIKSHEAGDKELDMTMFYLFAGVGVVATRFIALGMNNKDVYILAGIGGALFMFLRFYMMRTMMRGKN